MASPEPEEHDQASSSSKLDSIGDPASSHVGYRSRASKDDDNGDDARSSEDESSDVSGLSDLEKELDDFDLAGFRERRLEELKRE
jgi:hypothetical protein